MKEVYLFPTVIGLEKMRSPTSQELEFIHSLETKKNEGNDTSINVNVLEDLKMRSLKMSIEESLSTYFKRVFKPKNQLSLQITQSWCNYTEEKGFHHKHRHSNSVFSGVYYPQALEDVDRITFYKDISGMFPFAFPSTEYTELNSSSWWIPVSTGDLVIFPSSLHHDVSPLESRNDLRISLSFNYSYIPE